MKYYIPLICIFLSIISCNSAYDKLPVLSFTLDATGNKSYYTIDSLSFTAQDNKPFSTADTKGKIYTANFFFTSCPTICPRMRTVQIELAKEFVNYEDFMQVSFSIDPKRDTPDRLAAYAKNTGIAYDRWAMLHGNDANLKRVSKLFMTSFTPNEDGTDFYHSSYVALVDRKQQIRGFYDLLKPNEVSLLKRDIATLLKHE